MKKTEPPRSEAEIFNYLAARDGEVTQIGNMATVFKCTAAALLPMLMGMEQAGRIRRSHDSHRAAFFIPNQEFLDREAEICARANPPFKPLKTDGRFPEIYARIAAERAIPSIG
jgi:hypothetical protein